MYNLYLLYVLYIFKIESPKNVLKTFVNTFARCFRKTLAQAMLWRSSRMALWGCRKAVAPQSHAQAQIYAASATIMLLNTNSRPREGGSPRRRLGPNKLKF